MRHLRALLITSALVATACSGSSESVTETEPDATAASESTTPQTEPPATEASAAEEPPESDVVAEATAAPRWERGFEGLVPAGAVRLPVFGGVQFELEQERMVIQAAPGFAAVILESDSGTPDPEVDLVMVTETSDGEPITTVQELTAALTDHVGAELTSIGEVSTAIGSAQGFDYTISEEAASQEQSLLADDDWLWLPYPLGQVWVVDTERGPFLISAEAFEQGPLLDETIATLDRVLGTIEFADLDE